MADNQTKSNKEAFGERMRTKYPDRQFADDEELYGQINSDYDDYDRQLGEYKDRESKLTDLFSKDKRSAQFLTDMAKGEDPWIAVIQRMGIDGVTDLINDPDKQEAYAEANKEYVERLAKEKSLEEEYKTNFAESMDMLEQMQTEQNLSDEQVDAAMDLVMKMANEAVLGKFSRETVEMALRAINHDADVKNARTEGTVAGRNAKIDERLRKQSGGDGLPSVGGSNSAPSQSQKARSMFDLAGEAR